MTVPSAKTQALKEGLLSRFFLETCNFTEPFPEAGTEHFTTDISNINKVIYEFTRLVKI